MFDPQVDHSVPYSDFTSRGVSTWLDGDAPVERACRRRIFAGTNDGRLLAVDAATYAGPAFWQVHERVVTPSIVERTTQWFRDKVAAR